MSKTTETTDTTGDRPPVLTLVNSKGGVGKTSLVAHLAGALAARDHEVLVADLAPEGDLTLALGHADAYDPARDWSLHDALTAPEDYQERLGDLLVSGAEFDVLPSNEQLLGDPDTAEVLGETEEGRHAVDRLLDAEAVRDYDVVLVDNEPRVNALTDASIVAADGVVVPLYSEALSVQGLQRLSKQISSVGHLGGGVDVLAFVLNRVQNNNQSEAVVRQVREKFGDDHAVLEVRDRVDLQRSLARDQESIVASSIECDQEAVLDDLAAVVEEGLGL